jgi:hypothetical protein
MFTISDFSVRYKGIELGLLLRKHNEIEPNLPKTFDPKKGFMILFHKAFFSRDGRTIIRPSKSIIFSTLYQKQTGTGTE